VALDAFQAAPASGLRFSSARFPAGSFAEIPMASTWSRAGFWSRVGWALVSCSRRLG
jgi:hypothetical protein